MIAGRSVDRSPDRCIPPESRWREPTEWTRANAKLIGFPIPQPPDAMRCNRSATDEIILCLRELFSPERFRGEPPVEVQLFAEWQAAHELPVGHGLQAVHEPLAAHGPLVVHEPLAAHGPLAAREL